MNLPFAFGSTLLLSLFSYFVTALFKPPTRAGVILALYLSAFAQIVLVAQVGGTIHELSNRGFWIVLQSALTMGAGFIWWMQGKSRLTFALPFAFNRSSVRASMRRYPYLWILGVSVFITYAVSFVVILFAVPNEFDAMTYRMARIGYWYQNSSLMPWLTPNLGQTTYPQNAELVRLWSILLRGTDQLAAYSSWISGLVSMVAILGLGNFIGFKKEHTLFAAFVWTTLPQNILQLTSHQVDMVVAACVLSVMYFLYLGIQYKNAPYLILSGIGFGLGFGTKPTIYFLIPGIGLAVLALWLAQPRQRFRYIVVWAIACLAGLLLFGIYVYILNLISTSKWIGSPDFVDSVIREEISRTELFLLNTPRYLYGLVEFTGLPLLIDVLLTTAKNFTALALLRGTPFLGSEFDAFLKTYNPPLEVTTWYGPLGFLLFLPGNLWGLWYAFKRRDYHCLGLAMIPVIFFLLHSMGLYWTPRRARYHVPAVALGAVFLLWPLLYTGKWYRRLKWFSVFLVPIIVANTLLYNGLRPLIGSNAIWTNSRIEQYAIYKPERLAMFEAVETYVPSDGVLGLVFRNHQYEYGFFGAHFERRLLPIRFDASMNSLTELRDTPPTFTAAIPPRIQEAPLPDYLLIQNDYLEHIQDFSEFEMLASLEIGLSLFHWTGSEEH